MPNLINNLHKEIYHLFYRSLNFIRSVQRIVATKSVLVLGDSHASVFRDWRFLMCFPLSHFDLCVVTGATASGLENPNSKTQAYSLFKQCFYSEPFDVVIVMLGEVDCGFVIWYRAEKYKESIDEAFQKAVDAYINFLDEINQSRSSLVVISVPLPTISDSGPKGEVAKLRLQVQVSQLDRTNLTIRFNTEVGKKCQEKGIVFLNFDDICLGQNGLIKLQFLNRHLLDHHYKQSVYAKLLCDELKRLPNEII